LQHIFPKISPEIALESREGMRPRRLIVGLALPNQAFQLILTMISPRPAAGRFQLLRCCFPAFYYIIYLRLVIIDKNDVKKHQTGYNQNKQGNLCSRGSRFDRAIISCGTRLSQNDKPKGMLTMKRISKNLYILILLLTAVLTAACRAPAATTPSTGTQPVTTQPAGAVQKISPADAREMLKDTRTVLLDVRTAEEYAESHIPGSRLMPYDEISNRIADLPKDKSTPIIVYCRTGRRSALAAETLHGLGYTAVFDLGGLQDWPYETVK
jgi:phage shock protein E